ncbi:MAG: hypothetical protein ACYS99_12810, partial [Planctomycetota bacterium]
MKDLKTVLLIGIPVLAAAAALFLLADPFGADEGGPAGPGVAQKPLHDGPVPHDQWPVEPGQRGNPEIFDPTAIRPPPGSGLPDVLTLELLKELLAKGEWQKIEWMLKYAVVEDPVGVQELLVQALGKVRNAPAMVGKLLGFLTDETARK